LNAEQALELAMLIARRAGVSRHGRKLLNSAGQGR
jgi:hypothetical protein